VIREASLTDLPALRDIERAAGAPFRDLDMAAIADDEPLSVDELAVFQRAGRAWVYGDPPVAYFLVEVIDGYAHIEQVSVHPGHSRQGIGRRLVDHAGAWARARGLAGLTLTTFTDVPWNAPYYERLGFRVVTDLSPGLRAVREHEAELGLDKWPRVVMRRHG
jgi:GNAT superfamily N-acetyltransferase